MKWLFYCIALVLHSYYGGRLNGMQRHRF